MDSTLNEEQNLRKVAKSLYIFLATPGEKKKYVHSNSSDNCLRLYNIDILILFHPELQLTNNKPMIKRIVK